MKRLELDETPISSRMETFTSKKDHILMLGKQAVDVTELQPPAHVELQPETILFVPGVVAKRRLYQAAGEALTQHGYRVGLMAHRAASPTDVQEVGSVVREFVSGQFAQRNRRGRVTSELVMVGHSFGGGRSILTAHQLRRDKTRVNKIILEAPACFGGVAPLKAPSGLITEATYDVVSMQGSHLGTGARVAWDAVNYFMNAKVDGVRELFTASREMVIDRTGELIDDGLQVTGLIHRDDALIDPRISRSGMETAGVTVFGTVADSEKSLHIGHNAQFYHPWHVAVSIDGLVKQMRA